MKHTYSLNNLKPNKQQYELKNYCFFPNELQFQKGFISSKSSTDQIFGITSSKCNSNKLYANNNNKNNIVHKQIKKNHSIGTGNNHLNYNKKDKEKNLINIRLNIKSEIINNNFSAKKEHSNLSKYDIDKIIKDKNYEIIQLKQEIQETKAQIERITKQNIGVTNDISNSETLISEFNTKCEGSNILYDLKNKQKLSTKSSAVLSKNVKQCFKNVFLKNLKSLSKATTPTSVIRNGNGRKISYNLGNHFNYYRGNNIDIDTILSHSPRVRSSDCAKTITKSNSLVVTGKIKKKNIQNPTVQKKVNKSSKSYGNYFQKRSNYNLNNSFVTVKQNIRNDFENVKIRTDNLLTKYYNFCSKIC